jgi:pimeloyl-ACP methyl ester carboxylesterase
MRSRSYLGLNPKGFHRLHYTEWGEPDAPVVVCVHGLTQTARSFDTLAAALSRTHRVVCPDIAGRGRSAWLPEPMGYDFPQYLADINALVARLGVERIGFVGTSMGGIIGMLLSALPDSPIERLVINDVGPFVPKEALARIRDYVGTDPCFADMDAFETYLREIWAPFGALDDDQWRHLADTSARRAADGTIAPAYDPAISAPIRARPVTDADLWSVWDAIEVPALVLRGCESDLLTAATAAQMCERGPKAELVEFAGVGHAPALMDDAQIAPVVAFLRGG